MHISKVSTNNIKTPGSKTYELGNKTLLVGKNGSGKSSLIQTIMLLLQGCVHGMKSKGANILQLAVGGKAMSGTLEVDGHTITRAWKQTSKGASQDVTVDAIPGNGKNAAGIIRARLDYEPVIFDGPAFFAQSATEKMKHLLGNRCMDLLEEAEAANKLANQHLADHKARSEAVTGMALKIAEAVAQGDLKALLTDIEEKTAAVTALKEEHQLAKENDAARDQIELQLEKLVGVPEEIESKEKNLEEMKAELGEIKEEIRKTILEKDEWKTIEIGAELLDKVVWVRDFLQRGEDNAISMEGFDLHEPIEELNQVISLGGTTEEKLFGMQLSMKKLDGWTKKQAIFKDNVLNMERTLTQLQTRMEAKPDLEARLQELGPGSDEETGLLIDAHEKVLVELQGKSRQLSEVEGLKKAKEEAAIQCEKLAVMVQEAKDLHAQKGEELKAELGKVVSVMSEAAKSILPFGELAIRIDDMQIGWEKPDVDEGHVFVARDALSGGEKAIFDAALGRAISGPEGIVAIEAAECDLDTMHNTMANIDEADPGQVIMLHWSKELSCPDHWTKIVF